MSAPKERVVLLDEGGNAIGTASKAAVHHAHTPLHLAFSCYLFDESGRLLITRRALDKPTFPGVWTNSVCGHPAPGEDIFEAVRRRTSQELGLAVHDVRLAVPDFRYEATMSNGVRENEMCPVFTALASGEAAPDPSEVAEVGWVPWGPFREAVLAGSRTVSAWCALQVAELTGRETDQGGIGTDRFARADVVDLPSAALGCLRGGRD
jgi:isopentenyl-diphosphate Delta-isomerase